MNDLISAFNDYFEVVAANTPELQTQVFRLRYQVYCLEMGWEHPSKGLEVDGLECDEYDARSAHYLLRHRGRGEYVGAVRLVLPNIEAPEEPFPFELHAGKHLYREFASSGIPRQATAEISRLILSRSVRARPGESTSPHGTATNMPSADEQGRRRFPHPVLGLAAALMRMSLEHQISHVCAFMEPVFNRLLRYFGLQLKPIGPVVQFQGARQPFLGVIGDVIDSAYDQSRDVWALITERGSLWPPPSRAV